MPLHLDTTGGLGHPWYGPDTGVMPSTEHVGFEPEVGTQDVVAQPPITLRDSHPTFVLLHV